MQNSHLHTINSLQILVTQRYAVIVYLNFALMCMDRMCLFKTVQSYFFFTKHI